MALYKDIVQLDGVTTNYHRILSVRITTNRQNSIAVLSYVNEDARSKEQSGAMEAPYKQSVTYETDYCPSMTIEMAYEYLKTLPEFEGSSDI